MENREEENTNFQWNPNNFPLSLLGDIYSEEDPFSWWKKEEEKQFSNVFDNNENRKCEVDEFREIEFNDYFPVQFTQPQHTFIFPVEEKRSPNINVANPFSKKQYNFEENNLTDFMNSLSFSNKGIQKNKQTETKKESKRKESQFFSTTNGN